MQDLDELQISHTESGNEWKTRRLGFILGTLRRYMEKTSDGVGCYLREACPCSLFWLLPTVTTSSTASVTMRSKARQSHD